MRRELCLALGISLFGASAQAQPADGLSRLFRREAEVIAGTTTGLCRLPLPAEVLSASAPSLSDVRLFDGAGAEVPYLVDSARQPVRARSDRVTEERARVLSVRRSSRARPGLVPLRSEVLGLSVPERVRSGSFELALEATSESFVREVTLTAAGDGRVLAQGSVFRSMGPLREQLAVPLPPGLPERIEVSLEGEGRYLEPSFLFRAVERPKAERELVVPLVELARRQDAGKTWVVLARPRGVVPDRLALDTSTGTFRRSVTLRDSGPGGEARTLAREELYRAENVAGGSDRELALEASPASDRLELEIDDGASPPLADLVVTALVSQPTLVFEAGRGKLLRFGGGRARGSDYDVQRFQGTLAGQALMHGPACAATLGAARDNPAFDPRPALEFALRPGPAVELGRFSHRRALSVPKAPEGLSRVLLAPEDIALLRRDLEDLRIVDASGKQWPYLIERAGVALDVPLGVRAARSKVGETRYALELPRAPLTLDGLMLHTGAEYVNRDVELVAVTEGGQRRVLHRGTLVRRPGQTATLRLAFGAERVTALELTVDDASDAPLALDRVDAHVAAGEVYLAAPAGEYSMLLGDREHEPARYELARARDLALAVPVAEAGPGAFGQNPAWVRPSRLRPPEVALWAAIVVAVAVLGGLTLRLARRESETAAGG